MPWIINLRTDPFETLADHIKYYDWLMDHAFLLVPAQKLVSDFLATFRDYPPWQKAATFTISQALEKITRTSGD